jgi:hypothetical protein
MKAKPWQIALIVIGLAVGIGSAAWFSFGGDDVRLPTTHFLVDVESGEIFEFDSRKHQLVLPARHPETGRSTLIRLIKDDEGNWYVSERELGLLRIMDKDVKVQAIDPSTGNLTGQAPRPKTYRLK